VADFRNSHLRSTTPFIPLIPVKTHRTIHLAYSGKIMADFAEALRQLCRDMPGWRFADDRSRDIADEMDNWVYMVDFAGDENIHSAAVAFYKTEGKLLRISSTNIVPAKRSQLTLEEYNAVATHFVACLKSAPTYRESGISISVTKDELGLNDLIPGQRCREHFSRYLSAYPLSFHPNDIRRLDVFICSLHQFRSKVSPDRLSEYLMENEGWTNENAHWVRNRIQVGFDILSVQKGC
jgi:hypothetical protein